MKKNISKNAVVYYRTETKGQESKVILSAQEAIISAFAKKFGLHIVKKFIDAGCSKPKNANSLKLMQMMDFCNNKDNKISTVIIPNINVPAKMLSNLHKNKNLLSDKRFKYLISEIKIKNTTLH